MRAFLVLPFALFAVASCGDSTGTAMTEAPMSSDLTFVRDYRHDGDACQLVGESAATVNYLDDSADLVACPTDSPDEDSLRAGTRQAPITTVGMYTLYSVPN